MATTTSVMRIDDNGNYQNLAISPSVKESVKETTNTDPFDGVNMENKKTYVKVKIKSLAEEAVIIRNEERKQLKRARTLRFEKECANKTIGMKVRGGWTIGDITLDYYVLYKDTFNREGELQARQFHYVRKDAKLGDAHDKSWTTARNTFWGLRDHRTTVVRDECRAAQIAYAFLRGKKYRQVENAKVHQIQFGVDCWDYHFKGRILPRVIAIAQKYSPSDKIPTGVEIEEWIKSGERAA
jgi:hypothetical protein